MIFDTVLSGPLEQLVELLELLLLGVLGPLDDELLLELLLELDPLEQLEPELLLELLPKNALSSLPPQAASVSASAETARIEAILYMTHPDMRFVQYRPFPGR